MRNNSGRVSVDLSNDDVASQLIAAHESNQRIDSTLGQSQLSFPSSTEIVKLPSGGQYYSEDHPLYETESVEIRYMTAKDEDILTSKSLLKQGVAIDRFIENIIVGKRIKAKDLLSGDKNAILVAARATGFGPEYTTKVTCPSCNSVSSHTFDLSEVETKEEPDYDLLGVEKTANGTFLITLPKTQALVELKLMTGKDETDLLLTIEKREKKGLPSSNLTTQLSYLVKSINGIENRTDITRIIENLPSYDTRHIREVYSKIVPNLDMNQQFECSNCSYSEEVAIPITVDFFWSR